MCSCKCCLKDNFHNFIFFLKTYFVRDTQGTKQLLMHEPWGASSTAFLLETLDVVGPGEKRKRSKEVWATLKEENDV